jgi:hypothetical protein
MDEPRDRLDEALDSALASYGEAPENDGLERRIMARITETAKRKSPMKSFTLAAGAATLAITVSLYVWTSLKAPEQRVPANTRVSALSKMEAPAPRPIRALESAGVLPSVDKPRRVRKNAAEPKLSQFPTPSPLRSEERALLQLVSLDAKHIPRELTDLGGPVEPIHIAEIEIKPIQLKWYSGEKTCCD